MNGSIRRTIPILATTAVAALASVGQARGQSAPAAPPAQDSSLNNLVHPAGYETCDLGAVGDVQMSGHGPQTLVLLPGWGLDASVFASIIDEDSDDYTYLLMTPAGYAETNAPPMPEEGTSYAERTWWRAYEQAVMKEIQERNLQRPILLSYMDGAQSALMIASAHPDAIAGIIGVFGIPQMEFQSPIPAEARPALIDQQVAQAWFRTVTQETWNSGMGSGAWFSPDPLVGDPLYNQSLITPVPNLVRYYCEHWATDITATAAAVECPTLAILPDDQAGEDVPMFQDFLNRAMIGPWTTIAESNRNVTTETIAGARLGVLTTHADDIRAAIDAFVVGLKDAE
jgi:pimeloyl-ACP methyl ester carboxylesterase